MFYFVIFIQTMINTGISIGAILLAGECLKVQQCRYLVASYACKTTLDGHSLLTKSTRCMLNRTCE